MASHSRIPLRQTTAISHNNNNNNSSSNNSTEPQITPNYNTYVKKSKAPSIVNSSTFSKKCEVALSSSPLKVEPLPPAITNTNTNTNTAANIKGGAKDEGYSTMSNELMHHIRMKNGMESCTSTCSSSSDKHNDSGIRINRASGDSSSSSSHMASYETTSTTSSASSSSSSARTTSSSSSSSSSNHSPRMLTSIINEEMSPTTAAVATVCQILSSPNDASSNISSCSSSSTSGAARAASSTSSSSSSGGKSKLKKNREIKKRYCFPTLKSFSYYYNNRYYHQCRTKGELSFFLMRFLLFFRAS